ncbi:hypothetical protein EJ08DRAFT_659808 [Tothia fuscella]|uniref:Uncharacterized protein n=1 Tax=Tothia fuscella TaxID=1048955 RepID=A0A9P4NTT5_9PEZI|nr:hypothetical protein EJ08DRAFT_659808 [Tothia fuscella]
MSVSVMTTPKPFNTIRNQSASEIDNRDDPFSSFNFFPPRDSDELFDALRKFYPHLKSHRDRLFRATIDCRTIASNSVEPADGINVARNKRSGESPCISPSSYSYSEVGLVKVEVEPPHPASKQQRGMEAMFGTFSAGATKPKGTRAMTAEEREDYRFVKKVGACGSCRKTKRKCKHKLSEAKVSTTKKVRIVDSPMIDMAVASEQTDQPIKTSQISERIDPFQKPEETNREDTGHTFGTMVLATATSQSTGQTLYKSSPRSPSFGDWATLFINEDVLRSPVLSPTMNMENWLTNFEIPQLDLGETFFASLGEQAIPFQGMHECKNVNIEPLSVEVVSEERKLDQTMIRRHSTATYHLAIK